mgnify:CR=1 FL=1
MPLLPVAPPQTVSGSGFFDYVTIDAVHRRVYAAHAGAASLLIVDADSGNVIGQVKVGPMAGSAPDTTTGHVYTGNGDGNSVSEVDVNALREVQRLPVAGAVDAIAYDPQFGRIYADEDNGTRLFVVNAKTFRLVATVQLPGHKPEYLAINPATHEIYQNIATSSEFVVIDPATLTVVRTIKTPEITNNHPLQYDAAFNQVIVGGANGKLSGYTPAGNRLWTVDVPRMDQCDLDRQRHWIACAGSGKLTLLSNDGKNPPAIMAQIAVSPGVHTVAIDPKTGDIWIVWGTPRGQAGNGYIQRFHWSG